MVIQYGDLRAYCNVVLTTASSAWHYRPSCALSAVAITARLYESTVLSWWLQNFRPSLPTFSCSFTYHCFNEEHVHPVPSERHLGRFSRAGLVFVSSITNGILPSYCTLLINGSIARLRARDSQLMVECSNTVMPYFVWQMAPSNID